MFAIYAIADQKHKNKTPAPPSGRQSKPTSGKSTKSTPVNRKDGGKTAVATNKENMKTDGKNTDAKAQQINDTKPKPPAKNANKGYGDIKATTSTKTGDSESGDKSAKGAKSAKGSTTKNTPASKISVSKGDEKDAGNRSGRQQQPKSGKSTSAKTTRNQTKSAKNNITPCKTEKSEVTERVANNSETREEENSKDDGDKGRVLTEKPQEDETLVKEGEKKGRRKKKKPEKSEGVRSRPHSMSSSSSSFFSFFGSSTSSSGFKLSMLYFHILH